MTHFVGVIKIDLNVHHFWVVLPSQSCHLCFPFNYSVVQCHCRRRKFTVVELHYSLFSHWSYWWWIFCHLSVAKTIALHWNFVIQRGHCWNTHLHLASLYPLVTLKKKHTQSFVFPCLLPKTDQTLLKTASCSLWVLPEGEAHFQTITKNFNCKK